MAVCPSCKSHDIERIRSEGLMRIVSSIFPVVKWRCRSCHHEFIRLADAIFTFRRIMVWLALLIFGFFIWLMQLDVDQLDSPTQIASSANKSGNNQQESKASANQQRSERDVSAYLPSSVIPNEKPSLALAFLGIDEPITLRPPVVAKEKQSSVAAESEGPSLLPQNANEELLQMRREVAALESNIASLTGENRELSTQVTQLQTNLAASGLKIAEFDALKASVGTQGFEAKIIDLESQVASAKEELGTVKEQLSVAQAEVQRLTGEAENYGKEIETLQQGASEATAKLTEREQNINALTAENEGLLAQNKKLMSRLTELGGVVDDLVSDDVATASVTENVVEETLENTVATISDTDETSATDTQISDNESDAVTATEAPIKRAEVTPQDSQAKAQIKAAVEQWRQSWQDRDIDGYLSSYSVNFDAGNGAGVGLNEWKAKRRYIIKRASELDIQISDFVSAKVDASRYVIRFVQQYKSATYQDEVIKQLVVVFEDGQWKIAREESI